uniref:Placental growth factor b n=1 Tax=Cyprinus carpio TaxID=7962 RepID=A0A8C2K0H4_CYPCA
MDYCLDFSTIRLALTVEMGYLTALLQIVAAVQLSLLPAQSSSLVNVNNTAKVMLFQEVWGKSFCRTIEKLVEVVQEYPGEVEHIFSPACVPLVRCAGCCGDENLECHPTLTSNTTMQVRIFHSSRPTIFTVSKVSQKMVPIIINTSSCFYISTVWTFTLDAFSLK